MKKITAIIMAVIMLAGTTANAAWEFDEKVITKAANGGAIDNGVIATYNHGYEGANMSEYSYVTGYYDLYGNRIEKPEKGDAKNPEIKENYFSKNNQSIIITEDDGNKLTDKMNYKINSLDEFSDGIAKVNNRYYYQNFIDIYGEEIFEKNYYSAYRIDNNEFLVTEGDYRNYRTVKILTAKGIIGEALYTDVKIDINGVQIPCRSVYGYAGVIAEDLRNFGFDVIWDEEKRLLSITRNPDYYNITPMEYEADGTAGTHYADIYGSDINVEYNGKRISSYCIDGRTIIKPEDLASEGITFSYDDSVRTLFMSVEGLERK